MTQPRFRAVMWVAIAAVFVAAPALAEVRGKSFELEIFGGAYVPTEDVDREPTWGARFGYNVSRRVNVQGNLSHVEFGEIEINQTIPPFFMGRIDVELWNADVSLGYLFLSSGNFVPDVHFGIGGNFGSAGGSGMIPGNNVLINELSDDSFTVNAGAGLRILLGRTFYLRPVVRARWLERRENLDDVELEYTLALGLRFGGRRAI